jgi:hypothetical protein
VREVDFPAVTFCNPQGHNAGEYVRNIFGNFVFLENTTTEDGSGPLKRMFTPFLDNVPDQWSLIEWAG